MHIQPTFVRDKASLKGAYLYLLLATSAAIESAAATTAGSKTLNKLLGNEFSKFSFFLLLSAAVLRFYGKKNDVTSLLFAFNDDMAMNLKNFGSLTSLFRELNRKKLKLSNCI